MTPPPTSIDGTDITGATIDGQDVQEITVDGQTVFTAGPIIQPSTVHRFPVQQGETTTIQDTIGNRDLTCNVDFTAAEPNALNGRILDPDGADDIAQNTNAVAPAGDLTLTFTVEFDNLDGSVQTVAEYGDSRNFTTGTKVVRSLSQNEISFQAGQDDGGITTVSYNPTQNQLIRLAAVVDETNGEVRIAEDGVVQDVVTTSASFQNPPSILTFAVRRNGQNAGLKGRLDNMNVFDEALDSAQLTTDFNNQPYA
jgi:hypothetical protein